MDVREKTVAQVVAENYKAAAVFKKNGIDFCCGGKIAVAEACRSKEINLDRFVQELEKVMQEPALKDVAGLDPSKLVDYIVDEHHAYVRRRIPEIEPFLDKVARVHGDRHPELVQTRDLFNVVKSELLSHMLDEETELFAQIKQMTVSREAETLSAKIPSGVLKKQILALEETHSGVGQNFKEIRKITNDLTPPEDACNTYRVTFSMLAEFEDDLHRHIHLENNVLFPSLINLGEG